jgi:hypothetical protein
MPVLGEDPFSQFVNHQSGCLIVNADNNRIGDRGCRSVSKCDWSKLTFIELGMIFFKAGEN